MTANNQFNQSLMTKPNRREFIRAASLAFGSVLLFPSCMNQMGAYYFFTPDEANCVIAICEQLIPKDQSPGATDAGVIHYIDRQLTEVFHDHQDTYRKGIRNLQAYCKAKYAQPFELIKSEDQVNVLTMLENDQLTTDEWDQSKPSDFFNLVLSHTMQGFYGSPIHGGNKDYMSFEMLRIDYPLVIGQNRYRS